jgi:hypothetical protein
MVRWFATAFRAPALSAFLVGACIASLPLLVACGGSSATGKTVPTSAKPGSTTTVSANLTPNDAKAAPSLTMPVSRFVVSLDDLGSAFITNVDQTYVLTAATYGASSVFKGGDGSGMLKSWGYLGGYETSFRPEGPDGPDKAVLNGAFYIYVEAHLFSSPESAQKAYDFFDSKLKTLGGTSVEFRAIGNASEAWKLPQGIITGSSQQSVDHRVMFRRGNLLAIVRTLGAESLMTIDQARAVAAVIDGKALGTIPAVEPTPTSNFTPNAGKPATSPTATKP